MKFNKFNILHISIYIYGWVLFNFIFMYRKFSSKKVETRIILYGHKLYGNLKSLYEELDEKGTEFYFLTLDYKVYKKLKNNSLNVLYGLRVKDMKKVVFSKIIVSDHGLHFMRKLINEQDNYFFDTNHGLPLQRWNEKVVEQFYKYEEVWLFSSFHKKVYLEDFGYKENNLVITGYGRLDYINKFNSSDNKLRQINTLKQKYGLDDANKIILYAPTWIHSKQKVNNEFMRPDNIKFIEKLNQIGKTNNLSFLFRPHLNTILNNKFIKVLESLDNVYYFPFRKYEEVENFLIMADMLITDWSSVALDFLLLDKPTLFLDVPSSFKLGIFKEEILRFGKISDLDSLEVDINRYINNFDNYFKECPQHIKTKKTIYDSFPELAAKQYFKRLKKYIN